MLNGYLPRTTAGLVVCVLLTLLSAAAAAADESADPVAVGLERHCHDLYYPEMTCYASEALRDEAFRALSSTQLAASSSGYVIAYVHASYAGSSVILSQDHGDLGFIGWSDKISSYKVYTSPTGYFYEHTWYGGRAQSYCCFTNVAYVGDTLNDTFSSFVLP